MKPTRLLVVERCPFTAQGVRDFLLAQRGRWEICAVVGDGRAALAQAVALRPQVAILDDQLPDLSALELASQLRRHLRRVEIIIHSGWNSPPWVDQLCHAKTAAVLLQQEAPNVLLQALEAAGAHHYFRSQGAIALSESYRATHRRGSGKPLTRRELEVAGLLARGLSGKEAAATLGLSPETIESHRGRIFRKLGLGSVVKLTLWAIDCGLVRKSKP